MIQGKRILLVLNDVNCMDQFDKLAIRCDYFQPGSIIIISTRNAHVLQMAGVHLSMNSQDWITMSLFNSFVGMHLEKTIPMRIMKRTQKK